MNHPPDDHTLLASMFERLPREVCGDGAMTRLVRYETPPHSRPHVEFVGVEVKQTGRVAGDLIIWELSPDVCTVWRGGKAGETPAWREEIHWFWRETSVKTAWVLGEFKACGPDGWQSNRDPQPFLLTGCAPILPGVTAPDQVELVEHNPAWRDCFEAFASCLASELGPQVAQRIEHFGSTAIPGIPAKPIIDVLVEIPSFEQAKRVALPRLLGPEWEYWWYDDKITLVRREGLLGRCTHHVHMAPRGHEVWQGIAFRDYLRRNRADARRYADLKQQLAAAHADDREAYTRQKSAFVKDISRKVEGRRQKK